jgi:tripartite-type tricarboxylate transporter receptor subunit TctC
MCFWRLTRRDFVYYLLVSNNGRKETYEALYNRIRVRRSPCDDRSATSAMAQWQPDRPINIIVPWSAGGSTDQVTRVVAPLLEEALGTEVVVVNQPGASGSIGTAAALAAPRDGYTWTANAIANNATYAVTGLIEDTSIEDYVVYLHVANVPVVSVNVDSPYQDFGELLDAMKWTASRSALPA